MERFHAHASLTRAGLIALLLFTVYLASYSGVAVTDDEQLFATMTENAAFGKPYHALPLFGNDRLRGAIGGVEPLHPLLGIPLSRLAVLLDVGHAQALFLLPAITTALAAALLYLIIRLRSYSEKTATLVALIFGIGTIALPYARMNFREPLAMCCLTASALCASFLSAAPQPRARAGLAFVAMLVFLFAAGFAKVTVLAAAPFIFLEALMMKHPTRPPRWWKQRILAAALILIGLVAFVLLGARALGASFFRFTPAFLLHAFDALRTLPHDHFWEALAGQFVSPAKGFFLYSPFLILSLVSLPMRPFRWREFILPFGSLLALAVIQALIYNQDWWNITWGTRALLPSLPLFCLACLPAVDRALHRPGAWPRWLLVILIVLGILIQLSRILVPDPAFANWLVNFQGRALVTADMWSLALAPAIQHWKLAFSGIPADLAWANLAPHKRMIAIGFPALCALAAGGILAALCRKPSWKHTLPLAALACLLMAALLPAAAQTDQRYYAQYPIFHETTAALCARTAPDDLLLLDAYLHPYWWYFHNFGCGDRTWLGLPYSHTTYYRGEIYYPRAYELQPIINHALAAQKNIFLVQSPAQLPVSYAQTLTEMGYQLTPLWQSRSHKNEILPVFGVQ